MQLTPRWYLSAGRVRGPNRMTGDMLGGREGGHPGRSWGFPPGDLLYLPVVPDCPPRSEGALGA